MKTSQNGINLIKKFEGFRAKAYKPVKTEKYYTIGYGHYGADVAENMIVTQNEAEFLLKKDLEKFESKVKKYDSKYHWNQNQFDALVSFAYHIGSIDQLTANGTRSVDEISAKIPEYKKAGGKTLSGLVKRRLEEKNLFDTPVSEYARPIPKAEDTRIYKVGSRGDMVRKIQNALNRNGSHLVVDGIFGENTYIAVISFQALNGLKKDGIVGPLTLEALGL